MRIFFDNVDFSSRSGPNSFAHRLATDLVRKGHEVCGPNVCDIHLAFIERLHQKNDTAKLVQRLDGIWFKPEEFLEKNVGIKKTYDETGTVVWQTEFDKKMITKHWGDKSGIVIGNGIQIIDTPVTHPTLLKIRGSFKKVFVCVANWHRQKRLRENTELFLKLQKTYQNSCLLVCGRDPDYVIKNPDIFYFGDLPHESLMQIYAISDWMIHLAWLDHFPNTVVEAISKGVPVIHTNSGGTKEVVKSSGLLIAENEKYEYNLIDYEDPPTIDTSDINKLPNDVIVDQSHLDIRLVSTKYEKLFLSLFREIL